MIIKNALRIFLLVLGFPFFCKAQKVALDAREGEVIVKGKIGNLNPPAQLWIYMGDEKWDTVAIRNGEFEYRKRTHLPAYGAMMVRYEPFYVVDGKRQGGSFFSNMSLLSLFFEEGVISVHSPVDTLNTDYARVSGSSLYADYMAYWAKEGEIVNGQRAIATEFNKATPEQLQSTSFLADYERQNEQLLQRWDSLIMEEVRNYPASLHSYIAFGGYQRRREPGDETFKAIARLFGDEYRNTLFAAFQQRAEHQVRVETKRAVQIEVGDDFPVFELPNPSGDEIKLTDFRGKYVFVDFWASWCLPCRKMNPELVMVYDRYKGESFEIVGISFDEDETAWREAIKEDGLSWLHASDLGGINGATGMRYGVFYIPQSYLVAPSGKVVAKDLTPAELDVELARLLNL